MWCALNLYKWWHLDLNLDWRRAPEDEGYMELARELKRAGLNSKKTYARDIAIHLPARLRAVRDDILKHRSNSEQEENLDL